MRGEKKKLEKEERPKSLAAPDDGAPGNILSTGGKKIAYTNRSKE